MHLWRYSFCLCDNSVNGYSRPLETGGKPITKINMRRCGGVGSPPPGICTIILKMYKVKQLKITLGYMEYMKSEIENTIFIYFF
jgi:hypothetical protein